MAIHIRGSVTTDAGRPLRDVAVSNGEQIVATDTAGRFELDADPAIHPFVFATCPDGFTGGSRWYIPTPERDGNAPLTLQRTTRQRSPLRKIRVGHITDLHVEHASSRSALPRRAQRKIGRISPLREFTAARLSTDLSAVARMSRDLDLVIVTGDLTHIGDMKSLRAVQRALAGSRLPIAPLWGANEGLFERNALDLPTPYVRHWQRVFGPAYYALETGRWLVILHPTEDFMFGPDRAAMKRRWLEAQLARASASDKPVIVGQHTEIGPRNEQWLRYLAARSVKVLLFGHYHSSRCYEHRGLHVVATPPLVFGGLDATPRGFRTIELSRRVERISFHALANRTACRPRSNARIREVWRRKLNGSIFRGRPVVQHARPRDLEWIVPLAGEAVPGRSGVVCLDDASGRTHWQTPAAHPIRADLARFDNLILATSYMGEVTAFDGATGRLKWSVRLAGYPHRWIGSPPVVAGRTIVAGTSFGGLEAFDLRGRRKWRWQYPGGTGDRWPHYGAPAVVAGAVCVRVHRSGVVSLDASTGRMGWEFGSSYQNFMPGPLLAGRRLFVPDRSRFHAVNAKTGRRLWTRRISASTATPRSRREDVCGWSCDECLLVTNIASQGKRGHRGAAQARRVSDGKLLWQVSYDDSVIDMFPDQRGGGAALAAPLLAGGCVWLGGLDGTLRAVDRNNGRPIASLNVGKPIMSMSAVAPRRLLVTTYPDDVICFAPEFSSTSDQQR